MQTIYLLLWIYLDVNYIYLQIHHHHVYMLCYYKTLMTNDIFDTPTKQEKTYLKPCFTPLHTISRKHVIQPENRSKTLGTGVSLNVPQVSMANLAP